jgi:hypothetical protein
MNYQRKNPISKKINKAVIGYALPGNSFPGTNNLSTPLSVITAIRITPPEEPSRDIANDKARIRIKTLVGSMLNSDITIKTYNS